MSEEKYVYLCCFYINGSAMTVFDNAEAAIDCEHVLRKYGTKQIEIIKAPVLHEVDKDTESEIRDRVI